jgi:uncharacterized phage-associated protein
MSPRRIVSAHDVARDLKRRRPDAGKTQIMKWLYIAQGLHLAWFAEPMYREDIEAWENGPVVADYWHDVKECRPLPAASELDEEMIATLGWVLDFWGNMTAQELTRMTHTDGGPWCQVTESIDEFSPRSPRISHETMVAWFGEHPVTRYRSEQHAGHARWTLIAEADAPGLADALNRVLSGEVIQAPRPA